MEQSRERTQLTIPMLFAFIYKYVYRSRCYDGNNGEPLELVCATVICEGQRQNVCAKKSALKRHTP